LGLTIFNRKIYKPPICKPIKRGGKVTIMASHTYHSLKGISVAALAFILTSCGSSGIKRTPEQVPSPPQRDYYSEMMVGARVVPSLNERLSRNNPNDAMVMPVEIEESLSQEPLEEKVEQKNNFVGAATPEPNYTPTKTNPPEPEKQYSLASIVYSPDNATIVTSLKPLPEQKQFPVERIATQPLQSTYTTTPNEGWDLTDLLRLAAGVFFSLAAGLGYAVHRLEQREGMPRLSNQQPEYARNPEPKPQEPKGKLYHADDYRSHAKDYQPKKSLLRAINSIIL
jgi:hypothetical protein